MLGSPLQIDQTSHNQMSMLNGQMVKVLVIEDETLFGRAVTLRLKKAGYACEHAENIEHARAIAKQFSPDIVLLDMRLPDGNGLDFLPELVSQQISTIIMTAHGEISDAVHAMKEGALDYLKKPIDLDELLVSVNKAEKNTKQNNSINYSKQRNAHAIDGVEFLGESSVIKTIKLQIERIADLVGDDVVPPTVMIHGETGTGKDVAARLLHASSKNNEKPFVHVDCASLPNELIESELFGHEKGAFTGAVSTRAGLIEAAEDGTIFLDEIGELPLALQAKLLNVLERRVVRRIGSTKERIVPARFVAATNRDLQAMSNQGSFRQDLYYRLNVMNITLPPLRVREGDAILLSQHFAGLTAKRYHLSKPIFTTEALQAIQTYSWPGNIRELRHQVSRAMLLSNNGQITLQDLALPMHQNKTMVDQSVPQAPSFTPAPQETLANGVTLDEAEKSMLIQVLSESKNNVSEAARRLGITRMTMRYRMAKHNINNK